LKDEQFLAKLFKAVDYLSDWFGRFIGAAHDASRILFMWKECLYASGQNYAALSALRCS